MKLGATDVIDALADDAAAQIQQLTKGGVDHAIEAVGRPESGALAVKSLKRGGTATILGMMPLQHSVGLSAMDLLSGKKLQGAIMGAIASPLIFRGWSISTCVVCLISTPSFRKLFRWSGSTKALIR